MSIKHALLGLLNEQPRGVGRLQRDFETATGGIWQVNVGQIYQTVKRLVRDELIVDTGEEIDSDTGRRVALLSITDAGRDELHNWLHDPVLKTPADRDELVMKIAMAAATGWDIMPLLQSQREAVIDQLRTITRAAESIAPTVDAQRLNYERRIFDLEAEARWIDRVESLARATSPGTRTSRNQAKKER